MVPSLREDGQTGTLGCRLSTLRSEKAIRMKRSSSQAPVGFALSELGLVSGLVLVCGLSYLNEMASQVRLKSFASTELAPPRPLPRRISPKWIPLRGSRSRLASKKFRGTNSRTGASSPKDPRPRSLASVRRSRRHWVPPDVIASVADLDDEERALVLGVLLGNIVKNLVQRWFLLRDVHAMIGTLLLQPRWAVSLLRGP